MASPLPSRPDVPERGNARAGHERPLGEIPADLSAEVLLRRSPPPPRQGWRRVVFLATGGLVNLGDSAAESRRQELRHRARRSTAGGHRRIAVLGTRAAVGTTTTALGLGSILAAERGDRVIVVGTTPERRTPIGRLSTGHSPWAGVAETLRAREGVGRYADLRAYTGQLDSRVEFLPCAPTSGEALGAADYRAVATLTERFYSHCLTDCGSGPAHPAITDILRIADHVVLVAPPSAEGAHEAAEILARVNGRDHSRPAGSAIVVLPRTAGGPDAERAEAEQRLSRLCSAVVPIPHDRRLAAGPVADTTALEQHTRDAYLELAAVLVDGSR